MSPLLVLCTTVGCPHRRAQSVDALKQDLVAEPPTERQAERKENCPLGVHGVVVHAPNVDFASSTCDAAGCGPSVPITIVNCTQRPIVVNELVVKAVSPPAPHFELRTVGKPQTLKRTDSVELGRPKFTRTGSFAIDALGPDGRIGLGAFEVRADEAAKKCVADGGIWGAWGMFGLEACNGRAKDAFELCRDGAECEGVCLFERYEVTEDATRTPTGSGIVERFAKGRPTGRCSERVMNFGCINIINEGESKEAPVYVPRRRSPTCID